MKIHPSRILHLNHSCPLHSSQTHLPSLSPSSIPLHFHFRKKKKSRLQKDKTQTWQNKISKRLGKSPHMEAEQGNPKRGKDNQGQVKESETHLLLLLWAPQRHQTNTYNIRTEDLMQPLADPVIATSVSVSSRELCLSWFSGSCSPGVLGTLWPLKSFCQLCWDVSQASNLLQFTPFMHNILLWVSVPAHIWCWGGLFNDGWTRHQSMSIAQYNEASFH